MAPPLILASGSAIRRQLLTQAGVDHQVQVARIDEQMIKDAMQAEQASPRDIADALAEMKARKISEKNPGALVLGCDQVLDHRGDMLSKPQTPEQAIQQLSDLRGDRHALLSARIPSPSPPCEAACLVQEGQPVPFTLPKAVVPNTHDRAVGQASSLRTFEPGASSSSKGGKNVFGQGGLGKETNYTK